MQFIVAIIENAVPDLLHKVCETSTKAIWSLLQDVSILWPSTVFSSHLK